MKLKDEPDGPVPESGQLSVRKAEYLFLPKENFPVRGPIQSTDHVEQGAFSDPRGPQNGHHLSSSDIQVQAPENPDLHPVRPVCLDQIANGNHKLQLINNLTIPSHLPVRSVIHIAALRPDRRERPARRGRRWLKD